MLYACQLPELFTYVCNYCPDICNYRILSKHSSLAVARKIHHLVAIRIGMKKMAEGDEYLERAVKPWSVSLGVFLMMKWRVLNSPKRLHQTGGRQVIRSPSISH